MEEVDQITITNLSLLGCDLEEDGTEITSLGQLTAGMMVEATARCLEAITSAEEGVYPHRLPPSMSARFKVGQTLAQGLRDLGFKGEVGYQTFLYPNGRDSRNVLMFLVERLPKEAAQTTEEVLSSAALLNRVISEVVKTSLSSPWLPSFCKPQGLRSVGKGYAVESSVGMTRFASRSLLLPDASWEEKNPVNVAFYRNLPPVHKQVEDGRVLAASLLERSVMMLEIERIEQETKLRRSKSVDGTNAVSALVAKSLKTSIEVAGKILQRPALPPKPKKGVLADQNEQLQQAPDAPTETKEERKARLEEEINSLRKELNGQNDRYEQLTNELEKLTSQMESYQEELSTIQAHFEDKEKEVVLLTKTHSLLPDAPENVTKLKEHIEKKQSQIVSTAQKWEEHRAPLTEELRALREAARSRYSATERCREELADIHSHLEECKLEFKVKEERAKELEKRLSGMKASQSRNEFTKRILDITENNKKQKVEIARVISEIVALQREINMLRGKLDRTFTVTENLLFRDARTDEANKKMYKMLAGIHENCSLLVEVIEDKGRLIREIRELEDLAENEARKKTDENLNKIMRDFDEIKSSNKKLKQFLKTHAANS